MICYVITMDEYYIENSMRISCAIGFVSFVLISLLVLFLFIRVKATYFLRCPFGRGGNRVGWIGFGFGRIKSVKFD
jgi:hypothetical protein